MGNLLPSKSEEVRILLLGEIRGWRVRKVHFERAVFVPLGVQGAGKSAALYKLKLGEEVTTVRPTVGK